MLKRLKAALRLIAEKRLTTVAGAWVYYFLTSVIPMAFLLVTAFGVFGVSLSNELVSRLPEEFREAGETIAATAENASKGVTVFFVVTVVFSCTTLLNQMSKDGDFIYGMKSKTKRGVMRRIWALVALASLFFAFLSMAFLFAFGRFIFNGAKQGGIIKLIITIMAFLLVILFGYVIIILLNRFISPVRLCFSEMALGSLVSLAVVVLGTIYFTIYLRFFANYNAFYGSLAGIVVFLLWAYILMLGLVVGAIINMRAHNKKPIIPKT
jgi:membrane protein